MPAMVGALIGVKQRQSLRSGNHSHPSVSEVCQPLLSSGAINRCDCIGDDGNAAPSAQQAFHVFADTVVGRDAEDDKFGIPELPRT
jgi:hypothetical protein